ncbi:MAG TPA: hypothetical protein VES20_05920, partial [Bryobacteraceae bacterium]|nr:hypothetical protein [Bryobacteraceae bacterium]
RLCEVSLTDASGVRHSIEVRADSLYEAVAAGLRDLRASGLTPVTAGPATTVSVRVKAAPESEHTVTLRQVESWLKGGSKSPQERLTKDRVRQIFEGA